MKRILVGGIGNIFLGDDGFGVEVARRLAQRPLPEGVRVVDFGIRGMDLAYALLEPYDAVVLIDAADRGGAPGTLYLIEPEPTAEGVVPEALATGHGLDPVKMLSLARLMGATPGPLYLVACEPEYLVGPDDAEVQVGLSPGVEAAVDGAVEMVEALLAHLAAAGEGAHSRCDG